MGIGIMATLSVFLLLLRTYIPKNALINAPSSFIAQF